MMKAYRVKPLTLLAIQFDGHNHIEVMNFVGNGIMSDYDNGYMWLEDESGMVQRKVLPGNYIVRDLDGNFKCMEEKLFESIFDEIESPEKEATT